MKSPFLGKYYLLSLRAMLVGRTLVGLRVEDAVRAIDWLASRSNVDAKAIDGYGKGAFGVVLLHAAVLDAHLRNIALERTLVNYRAAVDEQYHRDISEEMVPGVLLHYDLGELMLAASPRHVTLIDPIDAEGNTLSSSAIHHSLRAAFTSEKDLGPPETITVVSRSGEFSLESCFRQSIAR